MAASAIDERAWANDVAFLREHELHNRPEVARLLALTDPSRTTPASAYWWRELQTLTARFRAFHEEYAQVVAPPATLDGASFSLCVRQLADGQHVTVPDERVAQHIGIYGQSGGGKTTLAQHLTTHAYERRLSVITIDGKSDAQHFATTYPDTLIVAPPTPIAPLEPISGLSGNETVALLERLLKRVWWGGIGTEQVAHESLTRTYERHDHPSVVDWRNETLTLHEKGETYQRRDRIDNLAARLTTLIDYFPGIGQTPAGSGIDPRELCTRPLYFGYTVPGPAIDLIANWLFEIRFAYNRAHGIRALNTIGSIDESHLFLHEETIGQTATFGATFPLLREFGIGIVLTATTYDIPRIVRANIATHIVMNLSDATAARDIAQTIGVKNHHDLLRIRRGECILKTPEWPHAIRATFDPLTIDKNIPPQTWRSALARTNSQARTAAAREESSGQPAPAQPSPSAAHASAAPLVNTEIALNEHAQALLAHAARAGIVLTTEAFRDLQLHPQTGTRAKKQLLDLEFVEEERITIRRGRGSTAVAIRPTAAGYTRVKVKRHATRGGDSLQHHWLVHALAQKISGARIDATVGKKACDLLLSFNGAHAKLAAFCSIAPAQGELVAIEVEVSDPRRTAPKNIARNAEAGVAHTIIASMTPLHCKGAVVIDVFELLEAL